MELEGLSLKSHDDDDDDDDDDDYYYDLYCHYVMAYLHFS